ncbi:MAG: hypothetical protein WA126_10290 [Thermodesulfovibrionales bacterium]
MTLDIIASLITGAMTTCKMRTDLIEINKKLEIDVTRRKKMEEDLRKKMKELEEFYDMAIGRELRMKELKETMEEMKEEIKRLKEEIKKYTKL